MLAFPSYAQAAPITTYRPLKMHAISPLRFLTPRALQPLPPSLLFPPPGWQNYDLPGVVNINESWEHGESRLEKGGGRNCAGGGGVCVEKQQRQRGRGWSVRSWEEGRASLTRFRAIRGRGIGRLSRIDRQPRSWKSSNLGVCPFLALPIYNLGFGINIGGIRRVEWFQGGLLENVRKIWILWNS